jgi:hypothetical protein
MKNLLFRAISTALEFARNPLPSDPKLLHFWNEMESRVNWGPLHCHVFWSNEFRKDSDLIQDGMVLPTKYLCINIRHDQASLTEQAEELKEVAQSYRMLAGQRYQSADPTSDDKFPTRRIGEHALIKSVRGGLWIELHGSQENIVRRLTLLRCSLHEYKSPQILKHLTMVSA